MGQGLGKQGPIKGVISSEDWKPPHDDEFRAWRGALYHVKAERLPKGLADTFDVDREACKAGPEEEPYTFWERIGAVPVAMARIRPRQYYMPTTDFRKLSYDEQSEEEIQLRAQWMARMYDYGWSYPSTIFAVGSGMCIPLPFRVRLPAMTCLAITVIFMEFQRVYANAAKEKEMLDDFLHAKECWYIKNVETYELGVDTLPPGMTAMEALKQRQIDDQEMESMQAQLMREGMMAVTPEGRPVAGRELGGVDEFGANMADGGAGFYAGQPGEKRLGQQEAPNRSLLKMSYGKNRAPDVPI